MAKRRRRKRNSDAQWFAWGMIALLALLVLSFAVRYWYIALPLLGVAALGFYLLRWRRPQLAERRAIEERGWLEAEARQDRQARSLTLGGLLTLTAREFEVRVGEILAAHGYRDVEHVVRAGDEGFDLVGVGPDGLRVGVQCKRYAPDKLVRAPDVRLLFGDMTHARVRGVFVTTSGYTADAVAYSESHGITLIDGAQLAMLLSAERDGAEPGAD